MSEKKNNTPRWVYLKHIKRLYKIRKFHHKAIKTLIKKNNELEQEIENSEDCERYLNKTIENIQGENPRSISSERVGDSFYINIKFAETSLKLSVYKCIVDEADYYRKTDYKGIDLSVLDLDYSAYKKVQNHLRTLINEIELFNACPKNERQLDDCDFSSREFKAILDWWGWYEEELENVTHLYKFKYESEYRKSVESERKKRQESEHEAERIEKEKAKKQKNTYVYLMHDTQTGFYKIGYSQNPKVRESTLFSEKPSIELIQAWKANTSEETELHEHFNKKRVRGEWFDLEKKDISEIEKKFADREVFIDG